MMPDLHDWMKPAASIRLQPLSLNSQAHPLAKSTTIQALYVEQALVKCNAMLQT